MISSIICDDDYFTREWMYKILLEAIRKANKDARIVCRAETANEVLEFTRNNPGEYLFFLDLDLGQQRLGGLDLAKILRKENSLSKIVFVTSHLEKTMDILKSGVEPFGFVEKNIDQKIMIKEFMNVLEKIDDGTEEKTGPSIELPIGIDETLNLLISEITYVEALKNKPHYVCYHTLSGSQITVRDTMAHVLSLLTDDFVECHRSIIVNRKYVIESAGSDLKLSNGEYVACALRKRKIFERG